MAFLQAPASVNADSSMPAMHGTPAQIRAVAAYIWILEHFRNPAAVTPNSVMPRVWAAPWEMQALLDFLKTLRT